MITYKSQRVRLARKGRPVSTREIEIKNPDDAPGLINGVQADSSYEWNHARALWALGWTFRYQVPLFGGSMRRGGVKLDFLIDTRVTQTVVNPIGEYWHRNVSADKIEDARIMRALGVGTRILRPGTEDSKTFEAAYGYLKREIGRGGPAIKQ